jgi:hypothetical protein
MASQKRGDHNEEQTRSNWEDSEKGRIHAHKCIDGKEGKRVRRLAPGEQADKAVLGNESYTDARVETAKVAGHDRQGEPGPVHILSRASILNGRGIIFVVGREYLGEKPSVVSHVARFDIQV